MKINCKHPRFIQSPNSWKLPIQGYTKVQFAGETYTITKNQARKAFEDRYIRGFRIVDHFASDFYPEIYYHKHHIPADRLKVYNPVYLNSEQELLDAVLIRPDTGETSPLFMECKCCRCEFCKDSQKTRWNYRSQLQVSDSIESPFFFTLTYNDEHLIHYENDEQYRKAQVDEIQRFLKRFRTLLTRADPLPYPTDFKYFLVSEHGTNFGRLHYHGLLFNCDRRLYEFLKTNYRIYDYMNKAWNKGFISVMPAKDETGSYTQKYIGKKSDKPTICLHSQNFGKNAILRQISDIRKYPRETTFPFSSKGKIVDIPIYNYVSDISYPSFARQVSKDFRDLLLDSFKIYNQLKDVKVEKVLGTLRDLSLPLQSNFTYLKL